MVDICKCKGNPDHPQCATCYRKLAQDSMWQSYSNFYNPSNLDCEHYWHISGDEEIKELNRVWRE